MEYLQTFLKSTSVGGEHGTHSVYWIPLKVFNQLPIKRWKFNRPPDKERVGEIHEFMKISGRMDGVIYLGFVDDELICYESNHRREALKGIETLADVLVDIIWNATDEILKDEFMRLNKAVSVPELYTELTPIDVDIEALRRNVDDFCRSYKSHKVSTGKPQRPNFNRDNLTDDLYRIMKEHHITIDTLMEKLTRYNQQLTMKDRSKLSEKIVEKCSSSGLWLFAWSSRLNEKEFL